MPSILFFLEGNDDERFFARVIAPPLEDRNCTVRIWKYAREKRKRTIQLLKSVQGAGMAYVFVRDIDDAPSVRAKKEEMVRCFEVLTGEDIAVVVMEIESWYLAGANAAFLSRIGADGIWNTDHITKEQFNQLIPRPMSRIVFMQEILKHFDVEVAKKRNASFRYFMHRWIEKGD
ncbi:MAG: hypothetical protein QMD46_11220 [Methanomicrobiales archaeon]|nr:hypothetical protein [Methanomicrobiales archaeon]MDI6876935.1 hypothetical protein [Methanomicrobiales archaeon]